MVRLTEQGMKTISWFIAECKTKRKEVLNASCDTCDDTMLPTVEDILCDIEHRDMYGGDKDYWNCWGVTDNTDLPIHLEYGVDFKEE